MTISFVFRVVVVAFVLSFLASPVIAQSFPIYEPCQGNFDCDNDIDGTDASIFKTYFGHSQFQPSCWPMCQSKVPRTGQVICYGGDYQINCSGKGHDGDTQMGLQWPVPRFVDNYDGTITDALTGIVWLKNANCFGQRTWNEALSDSSGLENGQCGLTDNSSPGDWRLPNVFQLESLRNMQYHNPALSDTVGTGQWTEGNPFTNAQSSYYWSSTSVASRGVHAFFVGMQEGAVKYTSKDDWWYVWPVRGGY